MDVKSKHLEDNTNFITILSQVFQHTFDLKVEMMDLYQNLIDVEDTLGYRLVDLVEAANKINYSVDQIYQLTGHFDKDPEFQ